MLRTVLGPFLGALISFILVVGWEAFVPVVAGMRGDIVDRTPNTVVVDAYGWKIRNCEFVKDSQIGWAYAGDKWQEVPFAFLDDESPNSTRPLWKQSFGFFSWSGFDGGTTHVRLTVQHKCDDDVRTTVSGVWKI